MFSNKSVHNEGDALPLMANVSAWVIVFNSCLGCEASDSACAVTKPNFLRTISPNFIMSQNRPFASRPGVV